MPFPNFKEIKPGSYLSASQMNAVNQFVGQLANVNGPGGRLTPGGLTLSEPAAPLILVRITDVQTEPISGSGSSSTFVPRHAWEYVGLRSDGTYYTPEPYYYGTLQRGWAHSILQRAHAIGSLGLLRNGAVEDVYEFLPLESSNSDLTIIPIVLGWALETVALDIDAPECDLGGDPVACADDPSCSDDPGSEPGSGSGTPPPKNDVCPYTCECGHLLLNSFSFSSETFSTSGNGTRPTLNVIDDCPYSFEWNYRDEVLGFEFSVGYSYAECYQVVNCVYGVLCPRLTATVTFFDVETNIPYATYYSSGCTDTSSCSQVVFDFDLPSHPGTIFLPYPEGSPSPGFCLSRKLHKTGGVYCSHPQTLVYEGVDVFGNHFWVAQRSPCCGPFQPGDCPEFAIRWIPATGFEYTIDGGDTWVDNFVGGTGVFSFWLPGRGPGQPPDWVFTAESQDPTCSNLTATLTLNFTDCSELDPGGGGGSGGSGGLPVCYLTAWCNCKLQMDSIVINATGEELSYAGSIGFFKNAETGEYGWRITFAAFPSLSLDVGFLDLGGIFDWAGRLTEGEDVEISTLVSCSCTTVALTFPLMGYDVVITFADCPTESPPSSQNCKQFVKRGVLRVRNLNLLTRQWVGPTYCMLPDEYFDGYCTGQQHQIGLCADGDAPQDLSFELDSPDDSDFARVFSLRLADCYEWGRCYSLASGFVAAKLTAVKFPTYVRYTLILGTGTGLCAPEGARSSFTTSVTYEVVVNGDSLIVFPITLNRVGTDTAWPETVTIEHVT